MALLTLPACPSGFYQQEPQVNKPSLLASFVNGILSALPPATLLPELSAQALLFAQTL